MPNKEPEVTTEANVEMFTDNTGLRFVTNFTIKLPAGTNNFPKLQETVDAQVMTARNKIIEKLGQKLGIKISFDN